MIFKNNIPFSRIIMMLFIMGIWVFPVTIVNAQNFCEECEQCEEEEEEEGVESEEGLEEAEEPDELVSLGEEGSEITLEESDLIGTEVGEEAGEVIGEEAGEVAGEVVAEVLPEVVAGFAAADAIPIVGEVLAVVEAIALIGFAIYELFHSEQDAEEHRIHQLQRDHEKSEGSYWLPLVPKFSFHAEDLDGEKGKVSYQFFLKSKIGEDEVKNYLEKNNIVCPDIQGPNLTRVALDMDDYQFTDFTPCSLVKYYKTATISGINYSSFYYHDISDIELDVYPNKQVKAKVLSTWKFDANNRDATNEVEVRDDNQISLVLSTIQDKKFIDLGTIPYTAKKINPGTENEQIAFTIKEYDMKEHLDKPLWVRIRVKARESYGRIFQTPGGGYIIKNDCEKRSLHKLFREKEVERDSLVQSLTSPILPRHLTSVCDPNIRFFYDEGDVIINKREFPALDDVLLDEAALVAPETVDKTLAYFRLRDYQPRDTDKTLIDKPVGEINPFPGFNVLTHIEFGDHGSIEKAGKGKNHIKIDVPIKDGLKMINKIELKVLNRGLNLFLDIAKNEQTIICDAKYISSDFVENIIYPYSFHPTSTLPNIGPKTVRINNPSVSGIVDIFSWVLLNAPLSAGDIVEISAFYEDESISRSVQTIPVTENNSLPRAYYHLQFDENRAFISEDSLSNNIIRYTPSSSKESEWLIEHQSGGVYAIMNKESKKVLGIVNNKLGMFDWSSQEPGLLWNLEFIDDNSFFLYNIGSSSFINQGSETLEHHVEAATAISFNQVNSAPAILPETNNRILSRSNNGVLGKPDNVDDAILISTPTEKLFHNVKYQGCLRYTIYNPLSKQSLFFDPEIEMHNLKWSETDISGWIINEVEDNYFTLSHRGKFLRVLSSSSDQLVLDENFDDTQPHNYHFSYQYTNLLQDYVSEIIIVSDSLSIDKGKKIKIKFFLLPNDLEDVVWTSSNTDVVTVSENGVVIGESSGVSTVIAKKSQLYNTISDTIVVRVRENLNLAFEKPTSQSSTSSHIFNSWHAVDGDIIDVFSRSETSASTNPWWRVDLGSYQDKCIQLRGFKSSSFWSKSLCGYN